MQLTDTQEKVKNLFKDFSINRYPSNQLIAMPDSVLPGIMYMEQGAVEQYHIDSYGNRVVLHTFRKGAFFPMSWVINNTPNEYFFETIEPTIVRIAPPEIVLEFLKKNNDVLFDLLSRVYRGTDVLLKRLALTSSSSAAKRLAYELVIEAYRIPTSKDGKVRVKTTQVILAARSGLVRETVSRQLTKMKRSGIVTIDDGISFYIKDLEAIVGL